MSKKQQQSSCDTCLYYIYDEDYESYMCDMDMDEDEYVRLVTDQRYSCPYYQYDNEYAVVKKQI